MVAEPTGGGVRFRAHLVTRTGCEPRPGVPRPPGPDLGGMHAWRQKVKLSPAHPGNLVDDTNKSHEVYKNRLAMTKPARVRARFVVPTG